MILRPSKDRYVQPHLIQQAAEVAKLADMTLLNDHAVARLTALREAAVYTKNAMMNANFAYLGWLLILFALFNSVFLGGFFRTAYGLGKPFILYSIAGFAVICLAEALHHFPGMAAMNSQTEGFGMQLIVLAAGVLLFMGMTALSCRKAQKIFEQIDL